MNKILRILHLEDVRSDAEIIKREITKSGIAFEWHLVSNKDDFRKALAEYSPDVIISDHTLPGFSSVHALKMVREVGITIPFILVTATISEEFAVSMMKEGVDDYLLKDRLQRLPNAVLAALEKRKREKEREEHHAEIARREANLHAIIETSDVTIYSLDINFKYITFNTLLKNTLKEAYGLDVKVGDNVFSFLEKLDAVEAAFWKNTYTYALSGNSLKFEKEFIIGNFHRYSAFSINPIWENESIIGLSCFAHDITEQKIAQENLRQSEERYRNIIETAQEGIWTIDANNRTTFVNTKLCDILQYSAEEIMQKSMFDFMDEEGREIAKRRIQEGKEGVNQSQDFKFITKKGEAVWTNLSNSHLIDTDGKYVGALAMVTDITKRKLYQQSLETSEANIKSIFENTHVAYVLLNPAFLIVSFNKVAAILYEKQLGKPLKIDNNLLDYLEDSRREYIEKQLRKVLSGNNVNYEISYSRDVSTWYNIQMSPVLDTVKNILGIVVAAVDITEKKESELQREKITADLIQRNKDLEQFTYIVSHNFRAPVANILGICQILHYPNLSPEEKAEIEKAISLSALKLDEVIIDLNNILQVKHEVNEKKEEVSFSELVDDIKHSIGSLLAQEGITILTDFREIGKHLTLKSYLYSIFYNLISNSIKYRQLSVKSVIEIKSFKNKNSVELVFKDNGRGIDLKKHSEKIFGLYKRFHDLETEGKGMGLFMVKTQVETLGGK